MIDNPEFAVDPGLGMGMADPVSGTSDHEAEALIEHQMNLLRQQYPRATPEELNNFLMQALAGDAPLPSQRPGNQSALPPSHHANEQQDDNKRRMEAADLDEAFLATLPAEPQEVVLSNVLCTCALGIKIDTREICRKLWNAEYSARQNSLTLKNRSLRLTIVAYSSGKMTCMGARTEEVAREQLRKYARLVQKSLRYTDYPNLPKGVDLSKKYVYHAARFLSYRVCNIKAEWATGYPVDLRKAHDYFKASPDYEVFYDPDQFPAVKIAMREPKLTMQLFATGKN
eukprot:TRINITY_DN34939_c0_g1_i2.p1 TRINITY_DN34939_c0_g1~~TRINITY_DN34939_c0_g1_i2.p1  ORF type:complete len:319 (-),score=21.94 TRINITY_DN34939_c0_g1_i2:83-937(-)